MTSVLRSTDNVKQGSAFYINILRVSDWMIRDEKGESLNGSDYINWPVGFPRDQGWPPGSLVLRDMGKTIRLPVQGLKSKNDCQRILRKVQYIDNTASTVPVPPPNYVNYNEGVAGNSKGNFISFYIELSGTATNNGNFGPEENCGRFARLAL